MKAEKPWLLVYDNVEQPGDIEKLTPVEGAHVLITTRWSDWGKAAAPVKIGVFPPDVAAQFLLDSTERTDRAGRGEACGGARVSAAGARSCRGLLPANRHRLRHVPRSLPPT